jgi:hypothetical protein
VCARLSGSFTVILMFLVGVAKGKGLFKLLSLHPRFVFDAVPVPVTSAPIPGVEISGSRHSVGNRHSVIAQG